MPRKPSSDRDTGIKPPRRVKDPRKNAANLLDAVGSHPALATPLSEMLGKTWAKHFEALNVYTVDDLLRHYPRRHEPPRQLTTISALAPGHPVAIEAVVRHASLHQMRTRFGVRLQVTVSDGHGDLDLTFFAKNAGALTRHLDGLVEGARGFFSGTVSLYGGRLQLTHPEYHLTSEDPLQVAAMLDELSRPQPVYPATAALESDLIKLLIRGLLARLTEADVPDPIPEAVRRERGFPSRLQALHWVHEPVTDDEWRLGLERFRFEEAFVLQAALAQRKARVQEEAAVARPQSDDVNSLVNQFAARLPFTLTAGQQRIAAELAVDLAAPRPMQRLLQGEVGSGKTILALLAMLQVVDAGGQAALLAPTEVLAAQHARTLRALLGPLAEGGRLDSPPNTTRVALLTGSMSQAQRRRALADAAGGAAGIVVGTHALLADRVQFADLGLVVVDEQHRFGVEQRDTLRDKGRRVRPHLLVMTATPIPRTVAMTVFGDLDTSVLSEIPGGRPGVQTVVVPATNERWMRRAWERVREEIDAGHQVFVVCPRISADDEGTDFWYDVEIDVETDAAADLVGRVAAKPLYRDHDVGLETAPRQLTSVLDLAKDLRKMPVLNGVEIEVLHGQLPGPEKDAVMRRFAEGKTQLIVATTVVEVGLDVPDATVMVIMDADRFGISQLHQLRGRVGRGNAPGLCLLISSAPPGSPGEQRVNALAASRDGFKLAELDLELRREGDVLGAAQSGTSSSLRLLSVQDDADLIAQARATAWEVVGTDPELTHSPELADAIRVQLDVTKEEFLDRL